MAYPQHRKVVPQEKSFFLPQLLRLHCRRLSFVQNGVCPSPMGPLPHGPFLVPLPVLLAWPHVGGGNCRISWGPDRGQHAQVRRCALSLSPTTKCHRAEPQPAHKSKYDVSIIWERDPSWRCALEMKKESSRSWPWTCEIMSFHRVPLCHSTSWCHGVLMQQVHYGSWLCQLWITDTWYNDLALFSSLSISKWVSCRNTPIFFSKTARCFCCVLFHRDGSHSSSQRKKRTWQGQSPPSRKHKQLPIATG